ncbi:MAG TPA: M12 family metallopeptidase [Pirellulaceae bacterium]|nr:M12 family metallopeptidase [Pirellulaceae bacterium]
MSTTELTGDQHACLELPVFNPDDSPETKSRSPTELAYMAQQGTLASLPARAAQLAAENYPAGIQSAPARAAFANHLELADKILRFYFQPGTPANLADRIIEHARTWTKHIDLKFDVVHDPARAVVRVRCSRLVGHASHIGSDGLRVPVNQETMTLGFSDLIDFEKQPKYNEFVVLHEVGHALGLIHEHNRGDAALDFDRGRTIAYFATRGLNAAQVQYNIFDRWTKPLVKFSEYDPKSIMHYMFPKEIMRSGQGTAQNFELSPNDIRMAQEMYGAADGSPPPPAPPRPTSGETQMAIDGAPAAVNLRPGQAVTLKFQVAAGQGGKPYTIYSEGGTQVVLQLLGPNDATKDATPASAPGHGTYDLTNDAIQATLAEGAYVVKVQHVSSHGGGNTAVAVTSGEKFGSRVLNANRPGT